VVNGGSVKIAMFEPARASLAISRNKPLEKQAASAKKR